MYELDSCVLQDYSKSIYMYVHIKNRTVVPIAFKINVQSKMEIICYSILEICSVVNNII